MYTLSCLYEWRILQNLTEFAAAVIIILFIYLFIYLLDPGTQIPGKKNYAMQRQNTKTSWNGLYIIIIIIIIILF